MSKYRQPLWAKYATQIMVAKGIKRIDLMEVFDVTTRGAVDHHFNGRNSPSVDQIISLAEFLDVPIAHLFGAKERALSKPDSGKYLTSAIRIMLFTNKISHDEMESFFRTFDKLGADEILKAAFALSEAEESGGDISNSIVDVMSKISEG